MLNTTGSGYRRRLCQVAALGGGAALFSVVFPGSPVWAAGAADALLLSCMDYRLVEETERYMAGRGLSHNYDHVAIAGASIGALNSKFPDWGQAFWEQLDIAIQLHGVHKVIVIDHRDCGAYKLILGEDLTPNPGHETDVHAKQLRLLRTAIKEKHATLDVELLLMALDGKVESIT